MVSMNEDRKIPFLNLCIMEDESKAYDAIMKYQGNDKSVFDKWLVNPWLVLAETKFKRAIIELHKQWPVTTKSWLLLIQRE